MRRLAWFSFLPVSLALAAGCGSPSVPAQPAYDVDVRPILNAHCIRCHGAGDMLNVPTEPTGPNAPTLHTIANSVSLFQTDSCYLDRFDNDPPGCTLGQAGGCKVGASTWASTIPGLVRNPLPTAVMPPPPAPQIDDWAVDILTNWSKEQPRICSNSANPDPTICPSSP